MECEKWLLLLDRCHEDVNVMYIVHSSKSTKKGKTPRQNAAAQPPNRNQFENAAKMFEKKKNVQKTDENKSKSR